MDENVREFFGRYRELFLKALKGEIDMGLVASSYASGFVAASPAGVVVGQNDEQLRRVMQQGFERYRGMGTKDMRIRSVGITPIDELHCLARVAWTATYDRGDDPEVAIDFDVHYLVQQLDGTPKIFGWVTGDEGAVLKRHGIL